MSEPRFLRLTKIDTKRAILIPLHTIVDVEELDETNTRIRWQNNVVIVSEHIDEVELKIQQAQWS